MKAFLLAAGQGKRLYPFTKELPKPLYKILGKPLIEWNVEKLKEAGYTDLIINIHHLGNKIVDYLGDGSRFDLKISYSMEKDLLGTGGGIGNALDLLGKEPFLVLSSDIWTNFNFRNLSLAPGSLGHMVLIPNLNDSIGDVSLHEGIVKSTGKQKKYTFSGIALVHPELFKTIEQTKYHLWESVLYPASKKNLVTGEIFNGVLYNINSPEDAERLDAFLAQE